MEDKIFSSYFKHKYLPHEVWVYKGKIIAITSLDYVDSHNIARVLNGEKVDFPIKNDFYKVEVNKPIFSFNENQVDPRFTSVTYAAISDFKEKNNSPIWLTGGSGIQRDSIRKTIRVFFLNQPILNSYLLYFIRLTSGKKLKTPYAYFQSNQVLWEVNDRSRYVFEKKDGIYEQDWLAKNGICFESLNLDIGQKEQEIYQSAVADLNRLLGLKVGWERRRENVLILKRRVNNKSNKSNIVNYNGMVYSIFEIFKHLNDQFDNPYVFNESGEEKTEIKLDIKSWTNITDISNKLEAAGFELQKEVRDVDKLVFSEVDNGRLVDKEIQKAARLKRKGQVNLGEIKLEDNSIFLEENKKKMNIHLTPSGLQYKIIKSGSGNKPNVNDKVLLNYEGHLVNGKIFQSTYDKGMPAVITVSGLISGFSEALQLMHEGDIWELYIPSSLAYGIHTGHGIVPSNSTLIFKVELIKILL